MPVIAAISLADWLQRIHPDDYPQAEALLYLIADGERESLNEDIRMHKHDGECIWFNVRGEVLEKNQAGKAVLIVGSATEITSRKANEIRVKHQAEHDTVTGLKNRACFYDRLSEQVSIFERTKIPFSIMMLDLDEFKQVNDQYGHHIGDLLLSYVAVILTEVSRKSDIYARVGGDEFMVILPTIRDGEGCEGYARRLLNALSQPIVLKGITLNIGGSIGYFIFDDLRVSAEQAITEVDKAMYKAKNSSKNRYASA